MYRTSLAILVVLLAFAGCTFDRKITPPDDVIGQNKMINILYEIHRTDAALTTQNILKNYKGDDKDLYNHIYKEYEITRKKFDRSLNFYTKNPENLKFIYKQLEKKAQKEQKEE